jgi:heme A synthase
MLNTKNINRFNLGLALFIICWGAWVRLSGSGAGCGEHWPLCNGEVIPLSPSYKTLVEFTHRLTSGIYGLTVLFGLWYAKKEFGKSTPVFKWSFAVLVFTIIEALIGAVLVKKGLVENNASELRAFVIALHLANTYVLLSTHAGVEWFTTRGRDRDQENLLGKHHYPTYLLFLVFLIVGASGAVTALGNTLFPDTNLIEGMAKDFSVDAPFLIQLRVYHPIWAIILSSGLIWWSKTRSQFNKYAQFVFPMTIVMAVFGAINWLLLSPSWAALTHLLLGDILLLAFVMAALDNHYDKRGSI